MDKADGGKEELIDEVHALRHQVADFGRRETARDHLQELLAATERAQRQFGAQLATLIQIINELSMAKTVAEMSRRAVELGRLRLGFDRMSIWFSTGEPGVVTGSFCIDQDGQVCDERDKRLEVAPGSPERKALSSREPLVFTGDNPALEDQGAIISHIVQACAAMWDGQRVVGYVSIDNSSSGKPITEHERELLRLFGMTIGYIYTRQRAQEERERLIEELKEALAKIKTLKGLLPICANCLKIRDDKGYWSRIEQYISERSDAEFTHGLCPDCIRKLYPELVMEDQ